MFSLICNLAPYNRIDSSFSIEPHIQWVDTVKINFFFIILNGKPICQVQSGAEHCLLHFIVRKLIKRL